MQAGPRGRGAVGARGQRLQKVLLADAAVLRYTHLSPRYTEYIKCILWRTSCKVVMSSGLVFGQDWDGMLHERHREELLLHIFLLLLFSMIYLVLCTTDNGFCGYHYLDKSTLRSSAYANRYLSHMITPRCNINIHMAHMACGGDCFRQWRACEQASSQMLCLQMRPLP